MAYDLFGNRVAEPTPEEHYAAYINSPQWKRRCAVAIERAGGKCQRCGYSKFSRRLEVHHLTYDRLGHERDEDLLVVCHECHAAADQERQAHEEQQRHTGPLVAGFEAWMDRGQDPAWRGWYPYAIQRQWAEFIKYLNRLRRTDYPVTPCPLLHTGPEHKPDPYRHLPMPVQPDDPQKLPFAEPPEPEDI